MQKIELSLESEKIHFLFNLQTMQMAFSDLVGVFFSPTKSCKKYSLENGKKSRHACMENYFTLIYSSIFIFSMETKNTMDKTLSVPDAIAHTLTLFASIEFKSSLVFSFFSGLRKVYPYYFTFTTFTKGRWVGEKILDVFAREFRAHPAEEYERCIKAGTLTVNYEKVPIDYKLKHNDLLANVVHR